MAHAKYRIYTVKQMLISTLLRRPKYLGAFEELRKVTISFVMSVCLSVRVEQLGSHWTKFHENWYLRIFRKSVEKIQDSLKSDENDGHFTWRSMYIYDISLNYS
jgi:hypothetical protein